MFTEGHACSLVQGGLGEGRYGMGMLFVRGGGGALFGLLFHCVILIFFNFFKSVWTFQFCRSGNMVIVGKCVAVKKNLILMNCCEHSLHVDKNFKY